MQSLKSITARVKNRVGNMAAGVSAWSKRNIKWGALANALSIAAFVIGLIALAALIWLYVRPVQTADIKVPVATDQASYYPGEEISGIFFGEIYHRGEVRVLREVFCKNFNSIIVPPETARNGDFYDTQSIPRKLEGLNVTIGLLPEDIPIGANCVLQFTNVYNIQTFFGIRHVEYQYYTQNFSIVTKERRLQLECEAAGRKDCNFIIDIPNRDEEKRDAETPSQQYSPESAPDPGTAQPSSQDNNQDDDRKSTNTNSNPAQNSPPAPRFEERCTINLLGIKIGCRQVPVE